MCSGGSTEEGRSGEEAVRQLATPAPAVDVLGGNPHAAQNVAGESSRHAPQPVAAAPRPVPPVANLSTVPLPESSAPGLLSMESISETLPVRSDFKDSKSEEVPVQENVAEVVGFATVHSEKSSSSAQMQTLPAPPVASDPQSDSTLQELQYGSQTDTEESPSDRQSSREGAAHVVITGSKEKQFATVEYRPETKTNMELGGKEHTDENFLPEAQSQICFTSVSVPQSSVAKEQSVGESVVPTSQGSHIHLSGALQEQAGGHQDSKPSTLLLPSSCNSEITQPESIKENSDDARERQETNSLGSVEICEHVQPLDRTPTPSAGLSETPKAGESLCSVPSNTAGVADDSNQSSCDPIIGGEAVESSVVEERTDMTVSSSGFTVPPEGSPHTSAVPPLFDTGLVVSIAETSHSSDQIHTTETPLIAELVHSTDAQEIVVVREEAHISGDWSNVHLNQSYLLQREDGSVCEAAIINQLSAGEPKHYEEGDQPVEVYEFCSLVEEVAEETVGAGTSSQMAHSPAYEVNLFNALLEHPEEFTVREEAESHLQPSIHESHEVIISQQPLPASHDANQLPACYNTSDNLSIQSTRVAAIGHHLVLDANPAVEVANSGEVCLLEVAAVPSDSFTVEHTDASTQILTSCPQVSAAFSHQTEVIASPVIHAVPQKQGAEATAGSLSLVSPVTSVTVHVAHVEHQTPAVTVVSATKPEACASSHALTETPLQSICNVAVPKHTKPETLCTTKTSATINSNLLLLKPGAVLQHPPSFLATVSQQQNASGDTAGAHSSWSGTKSGECLPQTVSSADTSCASVALSGQQDPTQCSVSKTCVTAASPVKVLQPTVSSNITLQLAHTASATSSASKSDKDALTVCKTSNEADPVPRVEAAYVTPPATPHQASSAASVEREATTSSSFTDHQADSLYAEEESEDMEQDEATEAQEANSGQVSSPEEGSDDEEEEEEEDEDDDDDGKTEAMMSTSGSAHKVFL